MTMAQTGSAQREPSMEEILASIRRIIQDSDTAQQPADGAPELEAIEAETAERHEERSLHEVQAFRAELDEPAPAAPSMAEIKETVSAPSQEIFTPRAEVHALRTSETREEEPETTADQQDGPASFVAEETEEPAPASPVFAGHAAEAAELKSSIISDHAGRQVAASFGELSEAFAASRRRSFDDMAQEMLRPMLQEWLDNNLPTLVERLVREEIERVARGG